MVQLTNGCICCTINDDLVEAAYSVLEQEEKIDHIVIETTGVADPIADYSHLRWLSTAGRHPVRFDHHLGGCRNLYPRIFSE